MTISLSNRARAPWCLHIARQRPRLEIRNEARGFNAAKGSFIDLTLVVKP